MSGKKTLRRKVVCSDDNSDVYVSGFSTSDQSLTLLGMLLKINNERKIVAVVLDLVLATMQAVSRSASRKNSFGLIKTDTPVKDLTCQSAKTGLAKSDVNKQPTDRPE
ncbi:hypothetical protein L208DRAFT_1376520 [Tricholoma matsutake]|nr:hypothetical protein L208DRAFT_1376520 [Tricholoma matsutake 945]